MENAETYAEKRILSVLLHLAAVGRLFISRKFSFFIHDTIPCPQTVTAIRRFSACK
jgi:hypothetical protein